jgi:RNA polymerase sigma-70 factor, ECF subfamily
VRYQRRVFRLACRLTGETEAADVLQDTFLQVYRRLSTFRGESQFSTWLYRIATNAGPMHRRARARRPAEPLDGFLPAFDADGRFAATPEALQMASRVEELLDRQALAEKARAALERLPDLYRDATMADMPADLQASLLDAIRSRRTRSEG